MAIIGDVHGRADLLERLVNALATRHAAVSTIVCVGDYIDRGEHSARVLAYLQQLQQGSWPGRLICLKGNHEAMMLDYLDAPDDTGSFWLQNGGAYTLASFGISVPTRDPSTHQTTRARLRASLPVGTEAWLRALPVCFQSGNVFVAHAGADPNAPITRQDETCLLWGHPDFERRTRRDGVWVAHGHRIRAHPVAEFGRIGVDTGAYATNRLTAAVIAEGQCHFISTDSFGNAERDINATV
ncbi:MAG: metallophosphoesterase [Paracoccaceae bacterium]